MKSNVTVIGSGIGGMCAAARLACAGYETVVLEKLPMLGGRYTTLDYKGYKIPTGSFIIIHDAGPVIQTLKDVGVAINMRIPQPNASYRLGDKDYLMPKKRGVMGLISEAVGETKEAERVESAMKNALTWQEPSDEISFRDWLSGYTDNELIQKVFNCICYNMLSLWTYEVPAGEYIRVLRSFGKFGGSYCYPEGHLRAVIDALAGVIQENRGTVLTSARVKQIVVEKGTVKGVVAEREGQKLEITCDAVISNTGPLQTVMLAGEESFDKGYLKEVKQRAIPTRGMSFFYGCDKPLLQSPRCFNFPENELLFCAMDPSLTWPDYAPEGKNCLWCWAAVRSDNLEEDIKVAMAECRENIPGIDKHGELLSVQSYHSGWPVNYAQQGHDVSQKTPIKNLYNVGDGVKPRGYVMAEGCAESASIVVEDIKQRMAIE
jgi:phytoene dehydrogenase-like protein